MLRTRSASERRPAALTVAGLAALGIGILLYASDRDPAGVYAWPASLPRPDRASGRLGAVGGCLPSFVHTYALIMLLAAAARPSRAGLRALCLAWGLVEALAECGQHPRLAALIARRVPASWSEWPLLENAVPYFARGTFDPLDLGSILAGAALAFATARTAGHRSFPTSTTP